MQTCSGVEGKHGKNVLRDLQSPTNALLLFMFNIVYSFIAIVVFVIVVDLAMMLSEQISSFRFQLFCFRINLPAAYINFVFQLVNKTCNFNDNKILCENWKSNPKYNLRMIRSS